MTVVVVINYHTLLHLITTDCDFCIVTAIVIDTALIDKSKYFSIIKLSSIKLNSVHHNL